MTRSYPGRRSLELEDSGTDEVDETGRIELFLRGRAEKRIFIRVFFEVEAQPSLRSILLRNNSYCATIEDSVNTRKQ